MQPQMKVCAYAYNIVTKLNHYTMNTLLKYLGVILCLIGVVVLCVYKFAVPSNALLVTGLACELVGLVAHVLINKRA